MKLCICEVLAFLATRHNTTLINQPCLASTITFSRSTYSVNEEDRLVQLVLVLTNPSSTDITVRVRDTQNTATSK